MLRYSLYAVLAILVITVGITFNMDFGRFKGSAEDFLSGVLDREVAIDGPLHLIFGRTIDISAENLRLSSTEWSADSQLVSVRRIEARINTFSLIRRTKRIESLTIDGVRINLERNTEGGDNWTLLGQEEDTADEAPSNVPERLPVMVDDTRITDAILTYAAPGRPQPFRFAMSEFAAEIEDSERIQITLEGDINETPLGLGATAGLIENLIGFGEAEFELSGNLGEIEFEGNASFADLLHPSRPAAQLSLAGPNAEYLTDILGIDRLTSGPLDLSLSIAPVGERMGLNLNGDFGEFALLASGQFEDLQQLTNLDVQLSASGPSASTPAEMLGWENVPDDPFNIIGEFRRSGADVLIESIRITVGETQFDVSGRFTDFPDLNSANASLRINGSDFGRFNRLLGLPGRLDGPFELDADIVPLGAGGAELDITAFAQDVTLSAEGTITDAPNLVGTDLRIEFAGADLSIVTQAAGLDRAPAEPFIGSLTVQRVADGAIIEDGAATIGDDQFAFSGRVGDQLPLSWGLQFEASLAEVKSRLATFGIESEQLPEGNLLAAGSIRSEGDGFAVEDIVLSLADAEAELSGRIGTMPTMEGTDLALRASGEALSRLLPTRDVFRALNKPFNVEGNIRLVDGTLALSSLQLRIDDTQLTGNVELALDAILDHGSFSLEATSPDLFVLLPNLAEIAVPEVAPLALRASGEWAENVWSLNEFDMKLADGSLQASGTVDGPPNFDGTDLRLDSTISSISKFSVLAGYELRDEPAHLNFRLTGTRDEMSIDDFEGVFGDSDIRGEFSLRGGDVPAIAIDLASNRLNLTPYLPPEPDTPDEQASDVKPTAGRLIPDIPVGIDVLENLLVDANVRVNELNARERELRDVVLSASIADGALTVDSFELTSASGGSLYGLMALRPTDTGPEFGMRLLGDNISLGLPAFSPEELEDLPRYELDLAFITAGNTLREMAGNMNGYLRLVGGEGRMRMGAMRLFTQDFLFELFSTLNPFSATDPYSNLECTVILAAVESGTIVGDPALVIQSDRLNVFANAEVDLKTETVDADFNTVPRQGLGLSLSNLVNPYVKVSGTLANPSLGFDPESTLIEGGAAVATGGLSILIKSFADRFLSSRDPCGTAVSDADEEFRALEERYGRAVSTAGTGESQ